MVGHEWNQQISSTLCQMSTYYFISQNRWPLKKSSWITKAERLKNSYTWRKFWVNFSLKFILVPFTFLYFFILGFQTNPVQSRQIQQKENLQTLLKKMFLPLRIRGVHGFTFKDSFLKVITLLPVFPIKFSFHIYLANSNYHFFF